MKLNPYQKYLLIWAAAVLIPSLIHQFATRLSIELLFCIWAVPSIIAIVLTNRYIRFQIKTQAHLQIGWIALIGFIFAANLATAYLPAFSFLYKVSPFFLWSLAQSIGYFFTGYIGLWPKWKHVGIASIAFCVPYFIPAFSSYHPLYYGITTSLTLVYMAFKPQ